jgi:ankyrin repeat protein
MLIDMPEQTLKAIFPAICPRARLTTSQPMQQIVHYLSATLPIQKDEHIYSILHKIVGADYTSATTDILKLTVYLLSNKLLNHDVSFNYVAGRLVCNELLKWFQLGDNYLVLKAILSHKLPTIEALAEGVFASAVKLGDRQIVRILLDFGMNPDIIVPQSLNFYQYRPLQIAAQIGRLDLVELLLEFGAGVDLTERTFKLIRQTPLQIAARNGNLEIGQLLISKGAAMDCDDDLHPSALQSAALAGSSELVKLLLDRGADIERQTFSQGTPLECAIRMGASSVVDMLLDRGANVNCSSNRSIAPIASNAPTASTASTRHCNQLL